MARKTINVGGEIVELPEFPKRWLALGALGLVAVILFFSSFYTVAANEKGIIQRFGKYVRSAEPGLHLKLPFFIETVKKVPVEDVLKEEFGFRTAKAGVRTIYSKADYTDESLMLTGDLNSAVVEWTVQYRIKDPLKYLFNVRNVHETLRDVSESVMRQVVGDRSVDEVIVLSREEIEAEAERITQAILDTTIPD